MKKKIVLAMALTLLLTGCGKVPKLENGKDAVVSFKNGDKISVDDLYTQMKDKYALSILVNMIDKKVLEETFPDNMEKAKKASESYLSSLKESYETEEKLLAAIQQYYGFSTLEEYKEQVYLSYMQSYAVEAYAKEKITDKEIENYYKNMENDIEVSHILITPQVTDKMNDDEKKKAETEAETKALAELPTKEELFAKMLGSINSPASGIANSINAVLSQLTRAMAAVRDQKAA